MCFCRVSHITDTRKTNLLEKKTVLDIYAIICNWQSKSCCSCISVCVSVLLCTCYTLYNNQNRYIINLLNDLSAFPLILFIHLNTNTLYPKTIKLNSNMSCLIITHINARRANKLLSQWSPTPRALMAPMFGRRLHERLQTEIARRIRGRYAGHMLELARCRDLRFGRQRCRFRAFRLLGAALATGHRVRTDGRIGHQFLDGVPRLQGGLIRVETEANHFCVVCALRWLKQN